jgi:hypothetical protein
MREIRPSGSEGGGTKSIVSPYPYNLARPFKAGWGRPKLQRRRATREFQRRFNVARTHRGLERAKIYLTHQKEGVGNFDGMKQAPSPAGVSPEAQPPRCTRRILPALGGTCAPAKGSCARHTRAALRLPSKADHCIREFSP